MYVRHATPGIHSEYISPHTASSSSVVDELNRNLMGDKAGLHASG